MSGRLIIMLGDVVILAIVTVIGFASHGTASGAGLRLLTTYVPLVASWFFVAPFLGAYDPEQVKNMRQVWRPFWAMVIGGPLAAWMRGVWLNECVQILFVVFLTGTAAIGILLWRIIYIVIFTRNR